MKKGMIGIDCLGNPISHYDDFGADICFCYDMEQYIGVGACCHDMDCPYAEDCRILRDSVTVRRRW